MEAYPAIRLFVRIALALSWIFGIAYALFGLGVFVALANRGSAVAGLLGFLLSLVVAFLIWVWIRVLPEVLTVIVRIEANTRK